MTGHEWDSLLPDECDAIIEAWQEKRDRESLMVASLQHIVALAGGMKKKNGESISIYDFAPQLKNKRKPEDKESKLKAQLSLMAARSKLALAEKERIEKKGMMNVIK